MLYNISFLSYPSMIEVMEKLLNVNQLADILGIKRITIYEWVHDKKIPFIKLGKRVLFHPQDVEEFIMANKVKSKDCELKR